MRVTWKGCWKPWLAAADCHGARPELECVLIEPGGWMVATNTHILAAYPVEIEEMPSDFQGVVVPARLLELCVPPEEEQDEAGQIHPELSYCLDLDLTPGKEQVEILPWWSYTSVFFPLDTTLQFPDWRKPIKKTVNPYEPQVGVRALNPHLLCRLQDALGSPRYVTLCLGSDEKPWAVLGACGAVGFQMGCRLDEEDELLPDRVKELLG